LHASRQPLAEASDVVNHRHADRDLLLFQHLLNASLGAQQRQAMPGEDFRCGDRLYIGEITARPQDECGG
jgi:hypothetical protein